jgi:hypothetical protein
MATYNPEDQPRALQKVLEWDEKIPIGALYRISGRNVFGQRFREKAAGSPLSELEPINAAKINRRL